MRGHFALAAIVVACALPASALAAFPYQASDPHDYTTYKLGPNAPRPNDLAGDRVWMYASTPPDHPSPLTLDKRELNGIRGGWVVDQNGSAPQAWGTTTGRPAL